jgi:hypothetical protein
LAIRPDTDIAHPALLSTARAALEEAVTLPDLTALLDRAEVIRVAARKAKLSADAQNDWAEYKIDAERKAGAELARMKKEGERQAPGGDHQTASNSHTPSLIDLGVNGNQSSKWQAIASLPKAAYEAYKASARAEGEVTEAGALREAKAYKKASQPPKPPPDISEFTAKLACDLLRRFSPVSDEMTRDLEKLIEHKRHIPYDIRRDLAIALEDISATASTYARQVKGGRS